jgi:hypothetical protein
VVAQELEAVLPSMVRVRMRKLLPDDATETDLREVDPSDFTYILINAVKEQQALIERQEARIAALERGRNIGGTGLFGLLGLAMGALVISRRKNR